MSLNLSATIPTALTYDDVLLIPQRSSVKTRKSVSVKSQLSKNITLNCPIVAANMDTVCEAHMAITLARMGGIGLLHRFNTVEEQCAMVRKVKRAQMYKIEDPFYVTASATIQEAQAEFMARGISSLVVYEDGSDRRLAGLLTRRDLQWASEKTDKTQVKDVMTPRASVVTSDNTAITLQDAQAVFQAHKCSLLPVVTGDNRLHCLITASDIEKLMDYSDAVLDGKGRLLVGAAIGVKGSDLERARELVKAGADVLTIDIAHGHSDLAIEMTQKVKADPVAGSVDLIVGNICTAAAARDLVLAGADSLKVGVGPGSICITRKVTGAGFPQLSALFEVAPVARTANVPVIADGGVRTSGCVTKALAAGANTVMLGNLLSGTDESPGQALTKDGKKVKVIRGMAGYGANLSKAEKEGAMNKWADRENDAFDLVPEGVEAIVPYKGPVRDIIYQLVGGLKSGISYCGATDLAEMQVKAQFIRVTSAGLQESGHHDVAKM